MTRIRPIDLAQASGKAKQLLEGVQAKPGVIPNMIEDSRRAHSHDLKVTAGLEHTV